MKRTKKSLALLLALVMCLSFLAIGGYAVAVATDEVRRKGINNVKRERLLEAGAALVIPDFTESDKLIEFISERRGK